MAKRPKGQISVGCPTPGWYLWLISMDQASDGCLSHHSKDLVFDVFNPFRLLCGSALKKCWHLRSPFRCQTVVLSSYSLWHNVAQVSIGLTANKSWIVVMHGCHPISLSKANLRVFCLKTYERGSAIEDVWFSDPVLPLNCVALQPGWLAVFLDFKMFQAYPLFIRDKANLLSLQPAQPQRRSRTVRAHSIWHRSTTMSDSKLNQAVAASKSRK
jgi:hypothetical protein